jgi:hypothetical protein
MITVPNLPCQTATSANGAAVSYTVTASDDVDAVVTASCTPASGSVFPIGSTTVSCSATDAAGNTASTTFEIKVRHSLHTSCFALALQCLTQSTLLCVVCRCATTPRP